MGCNWRNTAISAPSHGSLKTASHCSSEGARMAGLALWAGDSGRKREYGAGYAMWYHTNVYGGSSASHAYCTVGPCESRKASVGCACGAGQGTCTQDEDPLRCLRCIVSSTVRLLKYTQRNTDVGRSRTLYRKSPWCLETQNESRAWGEVLKRGVRCAARVCPLKLARGGVRGRSSRTAHRRVPRRTTRGGRSDSDTSRLKARALLQNGVQGVSMRLRRAQVAAPRLVHGALHARNLTGRDLRQRIDDAMRLLPRKV